MAREAIITAHAHEVVLGVVSVAIDLSSAIPDAHKGAIKDYISNWAAAEHGVIQDMEFIPIEEIPSEVLEYWHVTLELINSLPYSERHPDLILVPDKV